MHGRGRQIALIRWPHNIAVGGSRRSRHAGARKSRSVRNAIFKFETRDTQGRAVRVGCSY